MEGLSDTRYRLLLVLHVSLYWAFWTSTLDLFLCYKNSWSENTVCGSLMRTHGIQITVHKQEAKRKLSSEPGTRECVRKLYINILMLEAKKLFI